MLMKERKISLYAHISAAVDNAHHCEKKVKNTSSEVTGEKISVEGLKIILVKSITRPVFSVVSGLPYFNLIFSINVWTIASNRASPSEFNGNNFHLIFAIFVRFIAIVYRIHCVCVKSHNLMPQNECERRQEAISGCYMERTSGRVRFSLRLN